MKWFLGLIMIAHHLRLYCPRYIPHVLKACRPNFFTQHGVICASVVQRGSSGTVKIFDNTSTTLRLPKPERVDAVQYAEAICHSLAQTFPERYHFLSSVAEKLERSNGERRCWKLRVFWKVVVVMSLDFPFLDSTDFLPDKSSREIRHRGNRYVEEFQNMLQTCQPDEIENKCLEMFDDLPDKAKLSIACSLYANELVCTCWNIGCIYRHEVKPFVVSYRVAADLIRRQSVIYRLTFQIWHRKSWYRCSWWYTCRKIGTKMVSQLLEWHRFLDLECTWDFFWQSFTRSSIHPCFRRSWKNW